MAAGTEANIPVMVDSGTNRPGAAHERASDEKASSRRHLHALLFTVFRNELDDSGHVNPAMFEAQKSAA